MNKIKMLETAVNKVQFYAMLIKAMGAPEEINCEYHKACGYIHALQELEVFDDEQFHAALDVLNAALREATKKAVLPLTQENDLKKGGPQKDDSFTHFSLNDKSENVKPLAFIAISVSHNQRAHVEIHGSGINLTTCLAELIFYLSKVGISSRYIYTGIKVGLRDAGLPKEVPEC